MAIGRVNTGGGLSNAFAVIAVTYPSGSVCICTNGTKTLRAKGTSGSFLFMIPEAGTWTVWIYDSDHPLTADSPHQAVSITTQYQAESVALFYELVLLDGSDECTAVTGGWLKYKTTATSQSVASEITVSSDGITIPSGNATYRFRILSTNTIDFAPFNTLHISYVTTGTSFGTAHSGIAVTPKSNAEVQNAYPESVGLTPVALLLNPYAAETNMDATCDISGVDSSYYVMVGSGASQQILVKRIWLT